MGCHLTTCFAFGFNRTHTIGGSSSCARVNARRLERNLQIKKSRVENLHGPLSKLQKKPSTLGEQHSFCPIVGPRERLFQLPEGVEERIRNLEEHLGLDVGPVGKLTYLIQSPFNLAFCNTLSNL